MLRKNFRYTTVACLLTALFAIIIIGGWLFNGSYFKPDLPGFFNFKFNTAVCFLFSSCSLYLLDKKNLTKFQSRLALFTIFTVLIITVLTLIQYVFKVESGIDDFFIKQIKSNGEFTSLRMYFSTSILFILFNVSLLFLRKAKFKLFFQTISLISVVFLSANFIIYLASIHFSNINLFLKTALNTTLLLIILYFGLLNSRLLGNLKFSFWKKISAYFILVLLVLILISMSITENNKHTILISNKIEHSNEAVLRSQKIINLSRSIVSNSRGFLISGNKYFLDNYNNKIKLVQQELSDLDNFTQADTLLNHKIDSLRFLVTENIDVRNKIHELKNSSDNLESLKIYEVDFTQNITSKINSLILQIEELENQTLAALKIKYNISVEETSKVIFLFQFVIVLLLIVAFLSIYNNAVKVNKARDDLKSNHLFLETILDNIPNMLFVKTAEDLRFTTFNKAGEDLLGVGRNELLGKNDYDLFPPEQAAYFISEDRKVMAQDNSVDFPEEAISTRFGEKWLHTKKIPVKDSNGKTLYMIGISDDITEKKLFNDNLKKATEEIFDLYNNVPCGYHSIDEDGVIVSINNTELNWLGYHRVEVVGNLKFVDLLTENSKDIFLNSFSAFKENGVVINQEFEMLRKDGTSFPVMLNASAVYDKNGKFLRSRSTVSDYTELKKLNQQILKFNLELENKVEEKTARLKRSNEELQRFAYVASHDLQEPLRMVSSFLNLLEKRLMDKLDDTERKYIHFAVDGAIRMKKLIQNLLDYSRLDTSGEKFQNTDCNYLLQNVINLFKFDISENGISIKAGKLPVINANPSQLQQVFQNVIGNAIKYKGKSNLIIEIGCQDKGNVYQFYIKDNGIGIDPKFFDQIFLIFKRLHNNSEYEGTGVGLSICKKIVQEHGGEMWVESKPEQGSTFYFTISKYL